MTSAPSKPSVVHTHGRRRALGVPQALGLPRARPRFALLRTGLASRLLVVALLALLLWLAIAWAIVL